MKKKSMKSSGSMEKQSKNKGGKGKFGKTSEKGANDENGGCSQLGNTVGYAPETICVELVPGFGFSALCSGSDTTNYGGGACNLVSKAWLELLSHSHDVKIVLNNAWLCKSDIEQGEVTAESVQKILPYGYKVVLIEMTGQEIEPVLQDAAYAVYDGVPGAYTYGAGIRFKVDFVNRDTDVGFVYDVEVNPGLSGEWLPLNPTETYLVATNNAVADGAPGYELIHSTFKDRVTTLDYTDAELFLKYATTVCTLEDLPLSEYSTQEFHGLNALIEGSYPCLEDESFCHCYSCD